MKILIITTYFPPDTAVAAVRPYMLAKYLSAMGHEVTVLRSGEILDGVSSFFKSIPVKVISYLGADTPAERYERGESIEKEQFSGRSRLHFLPLFLRFPISKIYHKLNRNRAFEERVLIAKEKLEKQKIALEQLRDEGYQIVFSTFGEMENVFAGQYAAKLFKCSLIQDFRDPMANRELCSSKEYRILKKFQDEAVEKASACTAVSQGVLQEVCPDSFFSRAHVLYNGYESVAETEIVSKTNPGELSFCYTGQLYGGMRDFSPMLKALRKLADEEKISLDKVHIHYAGKDFDYLLLQAKKYQLEQIIIDHGYVGREEAARIQASADIYTVLSWNTHKEKGVLTGKFYEGIRAGKPILAMVAGNVPYSELDHINKKYRYGFCYETCREKEQFRQLCDYLEKAYQEKMSAGAVSYTPEPALADDFRYDILSKKLESICLELIREEK